MEERRTLRAGQTTTIEIPFAANPLPRVTWTFNSGSMPVDARRIKEETIIGMTSLVLAKIKRQEGGKYKVTMENEFGKADFTFHIVVLGMSLSDIAHYVWSTICINIKVTFKKVWVS